MGDSPALFHENLKIFLSSLDKVTCFTSFSELKEKLLRVLEKEIPYRVKKVIIDTVTPYFFSHSFPTFLFYSVFPNFLFSLFITKKKHL